MIFCKGMGRFTHPFRFIRVEWGFRGCRGVAQLVEHRSPKPGATGSIPVTPANNALSFRNFFMAKLNPVLFLRQVRQEVSKVVWPTRREAMMSTLMVILFTVCAAVFFFVVDQILAYALKLILGLGG